MAEPGDAVTHDEFTRVFVWIAALGKALVKNGAISRDDIVAELEEIKTRGGQPAEMVGDIDGMIENVKSW
jgi:hypothetical protein